MIRNGFALNTASFFFSTDSLQSQPAGTQADTLGKNRPRFDQNVHASCNPYTILSYVNGAARSMVSTLESAIVH